MPSGAPPSSVLHHVTQVSEELAPTEIWSFAVNGKLHRGTGVSPPMVVTEGDTVDFTLVKGSTKDEGECAALDGLPFRRGQPRHAPGRARRTSGFG